MAPQPPSGPSPAHGLRLEPGARPLPEYELVERLGKGGYGEVWKAKGPGGVRVALKFISLEGNAGTIEKRALDLMRDVRHPHLLGVFGVWQQHGHLILALELADRTLLQRFEEARVQGAPGIPRDELWRYLYEAATALDYLNSLGIQHRDVKPQNILLVGGGVKVADFGLAKLLEHTQASNTGHYTPLYAAPEFFNSQTSPRSDQYSLAVSYCQLRGGRTPFEGNLYQLAYAHVNKAPDLDMLPEEERTVVARALAKKPEERWPSCLAFVKTLTAQAPSTDPPPVPRTPVLRPVPDPVDFPSTLPEPLPHLKTTSTGRDRWQKLALAGALLVGGLVLSVALVLFAWNRRPRSDIDSSVVRNKESSTATKDQPPDTGFDRVAPPEDTGFDKVGPTEGMGLDKVAPLEDTGHDKVPPFWKVQVPKPGEEREWEIAPDVRMTFCWIPPGTAQLGSPKDEKNRSDDEAEEKRGVYTSKGFWLGKYAVTQQEWAAVMDGHNPSHFCKNGGGRDKVPKDTGRFPVESVSWDDCQKFIGKLNQRVTRSGVERVFGRQGRFMLPNEDEWEYACRGGLGNKQPYYFGSALNGIQANCNGRFPFGTAAKGPFLQHTVEVGSYAKAYPHPWGLCDMHGNICQWCENKYKDDLQSGRTVRGGSCFGYARDCRAAYRGEFPPGLVDLFFGCRVCFRLD